MIAYAFLAIVIVATFIAFQDWRFGLLLTIPVDLLRDPVRKLTEGEPVWITHCGLLAWAVIVYIAYMTETGARDQLGRLFPRLRKVVELAVLAILPGAILSIALYSNGVALALFGAVSYICPILGLILGLAYAKEKGDLANFMGLYVVLNAVMYAGNIAEYSGMSVAGLGGLAGVQWVRQQTGVWVDMVSGWYRSPDVAGFHAGMSAVFAFALAMIGASKKKVSVFWLVMVAASLFVLFLAGRRKMFLLPVGFISMWVVLVAIRNRFALFPLASLIGMTSLLVGGGAYLLLSENNDLGDHAIYAATSAEDLLPKLRDHTILGSVETVRQSGILGSGLGVATQGARHFGGANTRAWQEDGVSRLFKELGVFGALVMMYLAFAVVVEFFRAYKIRGNDRQRMLLQDVGIGVVVGNAACFVVSHQHYSGDPVSAILPLIFLGSVFGQVIFGQRERHSIRPAAQIAK